ncbi:MAG TPA: BREX system P-loop protein BrxC, partial [Bacillota bacterium]|nr:BREX system P-loop protein BrxC [Bacillota bacterium]
HQLTPLAAQASQYPFLNALTPVLEKLKELTGKPYTWYLTELTRQEDALLDMKERVIDPVRKFMSGPQKGIFDNARAFVQNQEPNFAYIDGDEPAQVVASLTDPECFKGNRMQQVKTQVETLQEKVTAQIEAEIAKAKETVAALKGRLCGMTEFSALNGEQQEQITRPFNEFNSGIERQKLIAVIRDTLRRFEESDYQRLLSQMTSWAQPAPAPEPAPQPGKTATPYEGTKPTPPTKPEPRIEYVPSRSVKVSFDKAWLADETDVARYLESMREALLDEIRKGKRIQI